MNKSTHDNTKKKRPAQTGQLIGVRLQPDDLANLDNWLSKQPDKPSRPEAVRRLVKKALNDG